MKEVILIKQVRTKRSGTTVYVYRTPKKFGERGYKRRYVQTTRFAKTAKRYKTIEAARAEIAHFKTCNIFTNWEVFIVSIDTARIPAGV